MRSRSVRGEGQAILLHDIAAIWVLMVVVRFGVGGGRRGESGGERAVGREWWGESGEEMEGR